MRRAMQAGWLGALCLFAVVWGAYARLAGRQSVSAPGAYRLAWIWTSLGEELVEEWRNGKGRIVSTITITPDSETKGLRLRSNFMGGKEWAGRIGEGGRVTFVGRGLLKAPFVVEMPSDDVYELRQAKVDGSGEVVSLQPSGTCTRWMLAPASD